jgi:hypothetical protein
MPGFQNLLSVIGLEVPIMGLMKGNQDGLDLTGGQSTSSLALFLVSGKQMLVLQR